MPGSSEKKRRPTPHDTVTGAKQRAVPSLNAAWDYMSEADREAAEETVARFREVARKP